MQSYSSCALGTMSHCPKTSLSFKPFLKETTLQYPWMSSAPLLGIPLLLSSCVVAVLDGFSGVFCPMLLAHRQEQGRWEQDVPKELWLGQWWAWALFSAEQIPKPCNGRCHPGPSPDGTQGSGSAHSAPGSLLSPARVWGHVCWCRAVGCSSLLSLQHFSLRINVL